MAHCTQTDGVSLRELLPKGGFRSGADVRISGCTSDSRSCRPGDLFVAIAGTHHDGHDFAREAFERGAAAILAERPVPVFDIPTCIVPDTRVAHGQLCHALAGNPSKAVKVIGVTGTNGKTTTSWLIASILRTAGLRCGLLGTLHYDDTACIAPATHTTPPAAALAHWLGRMQANGCSHAVMEVSSHALAQRRVAGIEFDAACLTNVRRDHLDFHGSLKNYRRAKMRLFEQLAPHGFAALNADDQVAAALATSIPCPLLTFGIHNEAELTAELVERSRSEQIFLLSAGCETAVVRTQMIGDHHISNCLAAAAVGLTYGIDLPTVVRGLEAVERVPGRLERIECGQPFGVFVDYAHTADALESTLRCLRQVTAGRLICVFGAGGDRDSEKRPLMGQAVEQFSDIAIVTSDNPRSQPPGLIATGILSGMLDPSRARVILDREEAIVAAFEMAVEGDCVVIAGKGHETHQITHGTNRPFDDRQVARKLLYSAVPKASAARRLGQYMTVSNS